MANNKTVQEEPQVSKMETFLKENGKKIIYGVAALIVVVGGCMYCSSQSAENNQAALADEETLPAADFAFTEGNYQEALNLYTAIVDQYGSTAVGKRAKLSAALCEKELGNYAEAIEGLKDFKCEDIYVYSAALSALGDCQVETGDLASAATNFEKAASVAACNEYSPIYLKKAGLAYEKLGDKAAALKVYQQVKDSYSESEFGQIVDKYIARVK